MAFSFKSWSTILQEWKDRLRGLLPGVNLSDDSDWTIRGKALAGVVSGLYADQELIRRDINPKTAREPALTSWADTYGVTRRAASYAVVTLLFTGDTASAPITAGVWLVAEDSERRYKTVASGVLGTSPIELELNVKSEGTGAAYNLVVGDVLTFEDTPPPGFDPTASVTAIVSEARNQADLAEWAEDVVDFIQNPPAGGNPRDYERWPFDSRFSDNDQVLESFIDRHARGLGTVDLYITSGTADIDAAVDAGDPVYRIPGAALIASLQTFMEMVVPTTDDCLVKAPQQTTVDVTIGITEMSEWTFAEAKDIVEREIKRFLYKLLPGRSTPITVKHSELTIALGGLIGTYLEDFSIDPLDYPDLNKTLSAGHLASPGTLTVNSL